MLPAQKSRKKKTKMDKLSDAIKSQQQYLIDDFTSQDTWRIFWIMSEFVDGFETLAHILPGVSIFGSARTKPGNSDYLLAEAIAGKAVHIIGAGALIVCLADEIGLDAVEGIAALKDELSPEMIRVVFKDSGFADDVVKTNAVQILHQAGIEDVRSL